MNSVVENDAPPVIYRVSHACHIELRLNRARWSGIKQFNTNNHLAVIKGSKNYCTGLEGRIYARIKQQSWIFLRF